MKPALPRRPAKAFVVMVDVHDTLLVHRDGEAIPYEDGQAQARVLVPRVGAVDQVRAMEDAGFDVMFLSGGLEEHRDILVQLLEDAGFRRVSPRLILQDEWTGYEGLVAFKRDHALDWGAVLLVGDHDCDRQAAQQAQCAYLDVAGLNEGTYHQLFCWSCGHNPNGSGFLGWTTGRECRSCTAGSNALLDKYDQGVRDPPFEEDPAERDPASLRDPLEAWL